LDTYIVIIMLVYILMLAMRQEKFSIIILFSLSTIRWTDELFFFVFMH